MSSIKDYFNPRTDFFSPDTEQLTDFCSEAPIEHVILANDRGIVEAINSLARARIECQQWPEWQRYNGSIIYDKLPETVKKLFKPEYLDENGFVDVNGLQILEKETLVQCTASQKIGSQMESPWDRQPVRELVACPALSIRLAEGSMFDPLRHRAILREKTPVLQLDRLGLKVPLYRSMNQVIQGKNSVEGVNREVATFQRVWKYASELSKPQSQPSSSEWFIGSSVIATLALLIFKCNKTPKFQQRVIDVASSYFEAIWEPSRLKKFFGDLLILA